MVKNLPTMQETQVQLLGWEDLLEEEMATHSNILAWKNLTEESGRLQSLGSQRVGHDWVINTLTEPNISRHGSFLAPKTFLSGRPTSLGPRSPSAVRRAIVFCVYRPDPSSLCSHPGAAVLPWGPPADALTPCFFLQNTGSVQIRVCAELGPERPHPGCCMVQDTAADAPSQPSPRRGVTEGTPTPRGGHCRPPSRPVRGLGTGIPTQMEPRFLQELSPSLHIHQRRDNRWAALVLRVTEACCLLWRWGCSLDQGSSQCSHSRQHQQDPEAC